MQMKDNVKLFLIAVVLGIITVGTCIGFVELVTSGGEPSNYVKAIILDKGTTEEMLIYSKENKLDAIYDGSEYSETSVATSIEDDKGIISYFVLNLTEDYFNELVIGDVVVDYFRNLD